MSDGPIRNLIVVSDLHCGCQYGLFPADCRIRQDGGGYYEPSDAQKIVWAWWRHFWDVWVPMATRGEPYSIVVNGDMIDGEHHQNKTHISTNFAVQADIAKACMEREVKRAVNLYVIRGTECHVGKSGENEETIAEALGAVPDEIGHHSRFDMWMLIGGGDGSLVHFNHHIGTTGSTHYESTAVMKELAEAFSEAGRWNERAPDIIIRSHRHRMMKIEVPTDDGYGIAQTTPGWQLKTPMVYRILGGRNSTPQFGGILIRRGDEEHYTRSRVWSIKRTATVVA